MLREELTTKPYLFDAGYIGWLKGTTFTSPSNSHNPLLHYFGGIPFALPPVGPYRFRQARRLPACYRYGTRNAPGDHTGKAAVCPQPAWRSLDPVDTAEWDENCLQLNIYVPAGIAPRDGWPVFFYIHGGFLQWGTPNMEPGRLVSLMAETALKAVIVQPAYRLNAFGFLASAELQAEARAEGQPVGNQGFWDQRLALEWTHHNIPLFGGDASNITIGGYSAGAHSTFQQLAHELYFVPDDKAIIKRAIMWSNSTGVQPKSIDEHQKQFDELLTALHIPLTISASEKLSRLRAVKPHELILVQNNLKISEFRALSDDVFISKNMIADINNGDFARRMKARGIKLMNGECRDEHFLYGTWRSPAAPTYDAVYTRLCADYPEVAVKALMAHSCGEERSLPAGSKDWKDAFGKLYAVMQVHGLERGFHRALVQGGFEPGKDLLRYRFDWRTKGCALPKEWGVTHATDMDIWFWGTEGDGLTEEEKRILRPWNDAFAAFVNGDEVAWGTRDVREMKRLRADGVTDVWTDDRWDEGLQVWDTVNGGAGAGLLGWINSKL